VVLTKEITDLTNSVTVFVSSVVFLIQTVTEFIQSEAPKGGYPAATADSETDRVQKRPETGQSGWATTETGLDLAQLTPTAAGKVEAEIQKLRGGSGTWGKGLAAPAARDVPHGSMSE